MSSYYIVQVIVPLQQYAKTDRDLKSKVLDSVPTASRGILENDRCTHSVIERKICACDDWLGLPNKAFMLGWAIPPTWNHVYPIPEAWTLKNCPRIRIVSELGANLTPITFTPSPQVSHCLLNLTTNSCWIGIGRYCMWRNMKMFVLQWMRLCFTREQILADTKGMRKYTPFS